MSSQTISTGFAPTASGKRYVQQLVKHWSHKFETHYADGHGKIPFSENTHATFDVEEQGIRIVLTSPDSESNERMRGVIERHIDRFAFREAPLGYEWSAGV